MGAMKRFYEECAEAGRCPLTRDTFDWLDDVECQHQLDWIGYCEHDLFDASGRMIGYEECITLESARRLVAEGLANDEITMFVECFGDYGPACCDECGLIRPIALATRHGERFCAECE